MDYVPPTDEDMFMYGSNDYGETWPDTFFVSDTTWAGIDPELAINCLARQPDPILHLIRERGLISSNAQEVLYQRSTDGGQSWLGPIIISDNDSVHSFWPQIAAWGDSSAIVTWVDYKYSDQQWTGDAFISKSSDNGTTWSRPIAMTSSHLVSSCDIAASGDTLVLVYREGYDLGGVIKANVSFDGGNAWQGEMQVSESPQWCVEPTVAISLGMGHVAWSDARDYPGHSIYEAYYDRGDLDTASVGIIKGNGTEMPRGIILSAYPNPSNSSTIIKYNLISREPAILTIYNIGGQIIRRFDINSPTAGADAIIWNGTDIKGEKLSSGIYIAELRSGSISKATKMILLK